MDLIADTTFLVSLWRRQPWAVGFATDHRSSIIGIPWVVLGEFWHGAIRAGHDEAEVGRFLTLGIHLNDPGEVVRSYATLCSALQSGYPAEYRAIGQNDLWIAATAIQTGRPLLSRNQRHFGKIAGLELITPAG